MTFLTPIPAIIAACIACPLLILYYFLKLRRRTVRVTSTLLWERAVKDLQVNTPFRWIRLSLLLLVQILILAALLLALARPATDDPLGATRRVIILIDRSASMDARDGADTALGDPAATPPVISRLQQARLEALRIAESLRGGSWLSRLLGAARDDVSICVVDFAASPTLRTRFTSDASAIREAIESISQTDQPGNLVAALQVVAGLTILAADETPQDEPATLFILSDGSFPHSPSDLTLPRAIVRYVQIGPSPILAPGVDPASRPTPSSLDDESISLRENLGITAISARRDPESPATVRVFVRLQSNAPRIVRGVASLALDGQPVQSRAFVVGPAPRSLANAPPPPTPPAPPAPPAPSDAVTPDPSSHPNPARADTPTFESPVTFELDAPDGGVILVSIPGPDLLAADNAAAVVLAPAGKPRILVVAPDAAPDELLMLALESVSPAALSGIDPARYAQFASGQRIFDASGNELASRLSDWDLVVFDRYRPDLLPPAPSISIGAGLPIAGLSLRPGPSGSAPARFSTWRRTHPIMRSVSLDGVIVSPPLVMGLPDSPSINATVLAWSDSSGQTSSGGPLVALLEPVTTAPASLDSSAPAPPALGSRRLVLAFELSRSNWGIEFSFPVFIANAVEYLALQNAGMVSRSFRTDEPVSITLPAGTLPASVREILIEGPRTLRAPVRRLGPSDSTIAPAAEVAAGSLEHAGVYRLRQPDVELPASLAAIAVNLCDSWESRAAVATTLDLPDSPPSMLQDAARESRREVWHWFVFAALALLALEWLLFARGMKA